MKFISILGLIGLFTTACIHRSVALSPAAASEKVFYEKGLKALSKNNYQEAYDRFTDLLNRYPTTRWLPNIYFSLGLALEGLGRYEEAATRYKNVIEFYEGIATRDEADALYRYSICQEVLNRDDKMLLALIQLQDRANFLGKDKAEVEIPARTAAAYARLGNSDQAKIYFLKSENGLKKLRRSHLNKDLMIWLPKTLYSIGHFSAVPHDKNETQFKNFLTSLDQSQERLLRAAELGDGPWSKKAAAELVTAYKEGWDWIENLEGPSQSDPLQAAILKQEKQRKMAADFDLTIEHLKIARIPGSPAEPELLQVTEIFKTALSIRKKLNSVIDAPDIQDQNTPEAQAREGLKRAGKILIKK